MLIEVVFKYRPEAGTQQGLSQFDTKVSQPTLANEDQERQETEAVLAKLKSAAAEKQQEDVAEDLQIMIRRVNLNFKRQDFQRAHEVPFFNASQSGLRRAAGFARRADALRAPSRCGGAHPRIRRTGARLHRAHRHPEAAHSREQMAKPGVIYPARVEIETEMARNSNYLNGIAALMQKYKLTGWEEPFAKLKTQLTDYDAWVRATVLPKARDDFRLPPRALCARHGELRHRHSAGAACHHGAPGFHRDPGRDEVGRAEDCQASGTCRRAIIATSSAS